MLSSTANEFGRGTGMLFNFDFGYDWGAQGKEAIGSGRYAFGAASFIVSGVEGTVDSAVAYFLGKAIYGRLSSIGAGGVQGVKAGTQKIYSARELIRRPADNFHNFPQTFDDAIFKTGTRTVTENFYKVSKPGLTNTSILYELPGEINGVKGIYEIGTRLSTTGKAEVVIHRFFRPLPK